LIGIADVLSFAPSIIAISAVGLFVSALVLQSRREEEEEALEEMTLEDDEQAVSPVIATILMVAITVVLSGVIYVWASSLADTSAKGVPRITFTLDSSQALGGDASFHRITVTGSQVELATQAIQVLVEYTDSTGETQSDIYNLADTTVYGFYPGNSETLVTFTDAVGSQNGATKSSFDTGDTIYIRTVTADGEPMTNLYVSISYNPATGVGGSVLRTWSGL
jgi:flagellin-like protein